MVYRIPDPQPVRTRSSFGPRDLARFPEEPSQLGPALFSLVEEAARRGLPRPVVLGFSAETVEQHDLPPIARAGGDVHRFIAAVAGQEGIQAVAVAGAVLVRIGRSGQQVPAVVTFVEWPDGAWWSALRRMENQRLIEDQPAIVRSAWERHPRPGGLGGWWSRARVEGLALRMTPVADGGLEN